jgi:hypothetical protein
MNLNARFECFFVQVNGWKSYGGGVQLVKRNAVNSCQPARSTRAASRSINAAAVGEVCMYAL